MRKTNALRTGQPSKGQASLIIKMPKELHRLFKTYSAKRGEPMGSIITTHIESLLKRV